MKQSILALSMAMILAGGASAATTQAEVNEALRGNPAIYNGLFTAKLVDHIVKTCPDLRAPSKATRVAFGISLYNQARSMGFSRAQIEAFVEDKAERDRLQGVVESHLRRAGVNPASEAEVCAYARAQMAERTALGRRLFER